MSTHESDPNASGASSPPEVLAKFLQHLLSDFSVDKGKGSQRPTHQCVIKRGISKVPAAPSQDDCIDEFVIPPPHAKKHTSPKASKKGGG
jgi:hypothetical protein